MRNAEQLRDALEDLLANVSDWFWDGADDRAESEWEDTADCILAAVDEAHDALDATAGRPQMDQLVEWLEAEHHKHRYDAYMRDTLQYVLDHIREMKGITARPREEREDG